MIPEKRLRQLAKRGKPSRKEARELAALTLQLAAERRELSRRLFDAPAVKAWVIGQSMEPDPERPQKIRLKLSAQQALVRIVTPGARRELHRECGARDSAALLIRQRDDAAAQLGVAMWAGF